MLIATGVSLLAPFSWLVLAKAHSYEHSHVNYLLWFLPCVLLIAGAAGALCQMLVVDIWKKQSRVVLRAAAILCVVLLMAWPLCRYYQVWDYPQNTRQISSVLQNGYKSQPMWMYMVNIAESL